MSEILGGLRETRDLVAIPQLHEGEAVLVEALLRRAGLLAGVHVPFGEESLRLFVRAEDLEKVKRFLSDFRVRTAKGEQVPIPW